MDKLVTASAAVSSVPAGSTLVLPGPGGEGFPSALVAALRSLPVAGLVVVCPGMAPSGGSPRGRSGDLPGWSEDLRGWLGSGQVVRLVTDAEVPGGRPAGVETQFVPPVLLRQRLQASAAGTPGFLGPVGSYERPVEDGARAVFFGGDEYAPVPALTPDVALVHAVRGDARGNLVFADAVRDGALSAAKAARRCLAEAEELVPVLHPRHVQLPARHVDAVAEAAVRVLG